MCNKDPYKLYSTKPDTQCLLLQSAKLVSMYYITIALSLYLTYYEWS